jgi:hypothetical protein
MSRGQKVKLSRAKGGKVDERVGIVRSLDPTDPRNLDHPSHREQWLELARALGRLEAREEYERLHRYRQNGTDE